MHQPIREQQVSPLRDPLPTSKIRDSSSCLTNERHSHRHIPRLDLRREVLPPFPSATQTVSKPSAPSLRIATTWDRRPPKRQVSFVCPFHHLRIEKGSSAEDQRCPRLAFSRHFDKSRFLSRPDGTRLSPAPISLLEPPRPYPSQRGRRRREDSSWRNSSSHVGGHPQTLGIRLRRTAPLHTCRRLRHM